MQIFVCQREKFHDALAQRLFARLSRERTVPGAADNGSRRAKKNSSNSINATTSRCSAPSVASAASKASPVHGQEMRKRVAHGIGVGVGS